MITRARAQFFAAIAAGIAGCRPETTTPPNAPPPSPTPSTSVAAPPPSETQTTAAPSPPPPVPPVPIPVPPATGKLKCADYAKLARQCVPPKTTPSTGGNVPSPGPYTSWDKNGCYQANEIVGACNGISGAAGPFFQSGQCCFDICQGPVAPCGRALVVEGQARVAEVMARGDWSASPLGLEGGDGLRAQAARAWREDAALEHASIASFARLSLELLALGAPPTLVAAAHRAALDEVEHARVCFTIAAELAGAAAPMGPAPLSLEGLAIGGDLVSLAVSAAREGCVGETVAALALSRAAASCDSPALAAQLAKMADDELAHASLAWQCVAWACGRMGRAAYEAACAALTVPEFDAISVEETDAAAWHRLGRLTRTDMREVVSTARALVGEAKAQLLVARSSAA
jgi:hypothetical protein